MKKYLVQLAIGFALSIGIYFLRLSQTVEGIVGTVMAISDAFTVVGLLYVGFGVLFYASGTGFFDFLGYSFQRGASLIFPRFEPGEENYYEYKIKKQEERKKVSHKSTLLIGLIFVLISGIFTVIWYQLI